MSQAAELALKSKGRGKGKSETKDGKDDAKERGKEKPKPEDMGLRNQEALDVFGP